VTLVLVRHGRTALNARGLLQGRLDEPLDELGQHQAARVAARLGRVDRVITSPLRRAVETAERLGVEPVVDPRWIELDYGDLDGKAIADVPLSTWVQWRADPTFTPPGGEPLTALYERVVSACEELAPEAADRDVVVVSHVSPIKAAIVWALGVGVELGGRMRLDPASISRVSFTAYGPILSTFNETAHLIE
jgi:broad specificity phosphatase PhoE